jgi:plasmid stabilization system protein ParE
MKVIVSGQVRRFLLTERDYLRKHSSAAPGRLARRMRDATQLLKDFPMAGTPLPLQITSKRRLVVDDYVVDYVIVGEEVRILHMRHGRQQDPYLDDNGATNFEAES